MATKHDIHIAPLQRIIAEVVTDPAEIARLDEAHRKFRKEQDVAVRELRDALDSIAEDPMVWLDHHIAICKRDGSDGLKVFKSLKHFLNPRARRNARKLHRQRKR